MTIFGDAPLRRQLKFEISGWGLNPYEKRERHLGRAHTEEGPCEDTLMRGFPGGSGVKTLPANAGGVGSIPGSGRSPGGGNGNRLQYSCLENPMDRGAWLGMVHGATKCQTGLND